MEYSETYFFGVMLLVAAVVNVVLAAMLWFDSNNYIYAETPRYLRSRRLTGLSILVFGIGFLLQWHFMPHFNNLLMGKALSFSYFHIGGVLFSMSHTGYIDRHYLDRKVVVRDVAVLSFSLCVYWINAFIGSLVLTYMGSLLFFLHIGYLTWQFYSRFYRIYRQLGRFADFLPNDSDREIRWLCYSCHLIIAFGIGGMVCTLLFHDDTLSFAILLFVGVAVFSYIYKTLDSFGAIATEVEGHLKESEEYLFNEDRPTPTPRLILRLGSLRRSATSLHWRLSSAEGGGGNASATNESPSTSSAQAENEDEKAKRNIERWVTERHYTDPKLTIKDALGQMDVTEQMLNLYLEQHTDKPGYRQWLSFLRVEEAKRQMLIHPDYGLQAIADGCGYASSSTLARAFKNQEGLTPMEWLDKQRPS